MRESGDLSSFSRASRNTPGIEFQGDKAQERSGIRQYQPTIYAHFADFLLTDATANIQGVSTLKAFSAPKGRTMESWRLFQAQTVALTYTETIRAAYN